MVMKPNSGQRPLKKWGENPPTPQNPYGVNSYPEDRRTPLKQNPSNPRAAQTEALSRKMKLFKRGN